jgi:hypothetical protein
VFLLAAEPSADDWNAFNDPANYGYMPDDMRRGYSTSAVGRPQRSGWLVIDKNLHAL